MDEAFVNELASGAPTPGGGGASAAAGVLAAALSSMVGELTIANKRYDDVRDEVLGCMGRLTVLRARLLELIDEDAEAFLPLAQAYKLPRSTPEEQRIKNEALQEALIGACEVPIEIMQACEDVLAECKTLSVCGSKMAISDAGASALLAEAAARAASLNVYINVSSMDDSAQSEAFRNAVESILERVHLVAQSIISDVESEIGV